MTISLTRNWEFFELESERAAKTISVRYSNRMFNMSKKHLRNVGAPFGEFYASAQEFDSGDKKSGRRKLNDLKSVRARIEIVRAVNRSDIPNELDESIAQSLVATPERRPPAEVILDIIDDWARKWRLTDWMLMYGMLRFRWGGGVAGNLWDERLDNRMADGLQLASNNGGLDFGQRQAQSVRSEDFFVEVAGCDLTEVPWSVWEDHVMSIVKQRLSKIRTTAENRAAVAGLIRVAELGSRPVTRKDAEKYYDWFVDFQLRKEDYKEVGRRHKDRLTRASGEIGRTPKAPSKHTLRDGIRSVASAARIRLRPGKPGQRKGRKSTKNLFHNRNRAVN